MQLSYTLADPGKPALPADWIPVGLVAAMAALALIWNLGAGLQWQPGLAETLAVPLIPAALALSFHAARLPALREICIYAALWLAYAGFAVRLSYLAARFDFPMQDGFFARIDTALGFHWLPWAKIIFRPAIDRFTRPFYFSMAVQPALCVLIFSVAAPQRNRRLLTAVVLSVLVCIAISGLVPAIGPGEVYGMNSPWTPVVSAIRAGSHDPLPYVGIITFPSFHAALAVLFTVAHRGLRSFYPFAALNGLMLLTVPFFGNHYLVDILAGVCVAALCWKATARIFPRESAHPAHRRETS